MKKVLSVMSIASVLAITSVSSVNATTTTPTSNNVQVTFQQNEVKDISVLLDRAEHGVSDLKDEKFHPIATLENQTTKNKGNVKTYTTSQHLKTVKYPDGRVVDTYATTTFGTISPNTYDHYLYGSGWDSTISVEGYSTIYWNTSTEPDGGTYWLLDHANGGWTISDTSVSIQSDYVAVGNSGYAYGHGLVSQFDDYYPSDLTWGDYYSSSSWYPVSSTSGSPSVGATEHATLERGGTTWSFVFQNNA